MNLLLASGIALQAVHISRVYKMQKEKEVKFRLAKPRLVACVIAGYLGNILGTRHFFVSDHGRDHIVVL